MKLWGGRFSKNTDKLVEDFHSSIAFDQRLYREDIKGSIAHARMLGACGIITEEEAGVMIDGLKDILIDIEAGEIQFEVAAEDIHMNIEKLLTERIGDSGKKLHTARSRNDQIALDTRLYLKRELIEIKSLLWELENTIKNTASEHIDTVMPGYTHLQKAQPITYAHHLLAYFQMFARDMERLNDCFRRTDYCPLGAGALAGTTFPIDREMTKTELGFAALTQNTLDSVSDRDYQIEFMSAAALLMMHLSRFSEEIILWSSNEFGFVTIDDAYSTGSSIMPQKKNPDVAELVRGKTGRVYGDLIGLLTVMKGLPLAYNKDMQEDKEALFDVVDTVKACLLVFEPMLRTLTVHKEKMKLSAREGFINATDMADYLAGHGVPFREAHRIIGEIVLACEKSGLKLDELPLAELKKHSEVFEADVYGALDINNCVAARRSVGGPAPEAVNDVLQLASDWLDENS